MGGQRGTSPAFLVGQRGTSPRVSCRLFSHRNDIRPLRGGAGRGSPRSCSDELDMSFFSWRLKRAGEPLRGGAGRVSTRSSCYDLDVPFKKKKKKKKARGRAARGLGFACVLFCHPSRQAMTAHSHRSSGAERGSRHLLVFLLSTPEAPPPGAPAGSKQRLGQGSAWAPGPPGGTGPAAPSSPPRAPERAPRPPPPPPPPVSV